jgi:hypothetical protein
MILDDPTTINGWIRQPGPINLRVQRPAPARDMRAAEGIVLAIVTGAAAVAWIVAFVRWFL